MRSLNSNLQAKQMSATGLSQKSNI